MDRREFGKKTSQLIALGAALPGIFSSDNLKKEKQIKPNALKAGDTIGLIAPAGNISEARVQRAIQNIESLGLKVKMGANILNRYGYLAGTDAQRLSDIHTMYANPEVKAIWCVRGGYGVTRLLEKIDFDLIRHNPKMLIGYSDITALHQAIWHETGIVGFHGVVANGDFTEYTVRNLKEILFNNTENYTISLASENYDGTSGSYAIDVIKEGVATGRLIGGNLSLITALIGTKYECETAGKILFIEEIEEKPYRVDRMLTQMLQSGLFDKVNGVAFGVFEKCSADDSLSVNQVIREVLSEVQTPIIYGLSFGHISNQCTLPIGIMAKLDTTSKTIQLLESATKA